MKETKKVVIWWWPWQSEKVEAMLERRAGEGWILAKTGGFFMSYVFEKREPARIRYCFDFQEVEKPEYMTLLADAGWRLERKGSGWYLWSMPYDGERPELYSDLDSLIRRSNTILESFTVIFITQVPVWIACLNNVDNPTPATVVGYILWAVLTAVLGGMAAGMALGIRKLKRRRTFETTGQR